MKNVFANLIQERDWVDEVFLVREKIMGMAKNGRPYLTLKLMDRSGEVEGRIWDRVDEFSACFNRDDFVRVGAKASVYMGRMQLVIQELHYVPESDVDLGDFLPVSSRSVGEMQDELRQRVADLQDADLKRLMAALLADEQFLDDFSRAPAAKAMHHVYLGGLLEHSLAVAGLAEDICRRYPDLDRDLLMVGALLHDVGKIIELRFRRSFEYTDSGKLLGHIMLGVELVDEKIRSLPQFPKEKSILLKHLLLSHHGQYEYGSPKRPKTIEAVILNFIDDLDAKINGVQTHIDKEPDSESSWTQYHRLYNRYFFKGFDAVEANGENSVEAPGPISTPAPQDSAPNQGKRPRKSFNNALEEQLKGKNLDLFIAEKQEKSK